MPSPKSIRRSNAQFIATTKFKGEKKAFADVLEVSDAFVGRMLNQNASQPKPIGDALARKIEIVTGFPINWLDHDHSRMPAEFEALARRYSESAPETQALIRLALEDPEAPIPEGARDSLRGMLNLVRQHIQTQLDR